MSSPEQIGEILLTFLSFRDHLRLYHFQTRVYARHKASDFLIDVMTEQLDRFMETLQGSRDMRAKMPSRSTIKFNDQTDEGAVDLLKRFRAWLLNGLPSMLNSSDKDLLNIRDEIRGHVNKTLYLFTFFLAIRTTTMVIIAP